MEIQLIFWAHFAVSQRSIWSQSVYDVFRQFLKICLFWLFKKASWVQIIMFLKCHSMNFYFWRCKILLVIGFRAAVNIIVNTPQNTLLLASNDPVHWVLWRRRMNNQKNQSNDANFWGGFLTVFCSVLYKSPNFKTSFWQHLHYFQEKLYVEFELYLIKKHISALQKFKNTFVKALGHNIVWSLRRPAGLMRRFLDFKLFS